MSDEILSKTQRKKQMHELQALGAELVELNEQQLASIELPERLLDAVTEARRMTRFEARRRQLQYIGKLMREVDPEPIRSRIAAWKAVSREHTARLHLIERWRMRLLSEESAMSELLRDHPHADASRLRMLVRNAGKEREAGQPPKSYRALFHLLNEIIPDSKEAAARDERHTGYEIRNADRL
jgi:ribosome-associated protein